jgi:hypothetical protein
VCKLDGWERSMYCVCELRYTDKSEEDEAEVIEAVRAVSSNMVLRGCFLHGICICRFTATQIKAKYH